MLQTVPPYVDARFFDLDVDGVSAVSVQGDRILTSSYSALSGRCGMLLIYQPDMRGVHRIMQ